MKGVSTSLQRTRYPQPVRDAPRTPSSFFGSLPSVCVFFSFFSIFRPFHSVSPFGCSVLLLSIHSEHSTIGPPPPSSQQTLFFFFIARLFLFASPPSFSPLQKDTPSSFLSFFFSLPLFSSLPAHRDQPANSNLKPPTFTLFLSHSILPSILHTHTMSALTNDQIEELITQSLEGTAKKRQQTTETEK